MRERRVFRGRHGSCSHAWLSSSKIGDEHETRQRDITADDGHRSILPSSRAWLIHATLPGADDAPLSRRSTVAAAPEGARVPLRATYGSIPSGTTREEASMKVRSSTPELDPSLAT